MKVYKEYLPISINDIPVFTDIQGELLTVEEQRNSLVVYFDADSPTYHRYLIYMLESGTQVNVEDGAKYLKTLMLNNGDYVLHIFIKEIIE